MAIFYDSKVNGSIAFDSISEKAVSQSDRTQKLDAEGYPLWVASFLVKQEGSTRSENLRVTIASKQKPKELSPYTLCEIEGLQVHVANSPEGKLVWQTATGYKPIQVG